MELIKAFCGDAGPLEAGDVLLRMDATRKVKGLD